MAVDDKFVRDTLEMDYACLLAGLKDNLRQRRAVKSQRSLDPESREVQSTVLSVRASEMRKSMDLIESQLGGKGSTRFEARTETRTVAAPVWETRVMEPPVIEQRANGLICSGYASVFYKRGQAGTEFKMSDEITERVDPNAFRRALKERQDTLFMYNHKTQLGRTGDDSCRLLVDGRGLHYEGDMPNTDAANEVASAILAGQVRGSSFRFALVAGGVNWHAEGGKLIRTLLDVNLKDVGPVDSPAYVATTTEIVTAKDSQKREADRVAVAVAMSDLLQDRLKQLV